MKYCTINVNILFLFFLFQRQTFGPTIIRKFSETFGSHILQSNFQKWQNTKEIVQHLIGQYLKPYLYPSYNVLKAILALYQNNM